LDLNTNAPTYKIVFETDNGKIAIKNTGDAQLENLSTGIIAFNVAKTDSEIISGSKNRTVYITSVAQDGRETFMYSGEWRKPSEQSEVDSAIATVVSESNKQKNLQEILDKLTAQNTSATSQLDIASANSTSSIKQQGQSPTVNRFGIKDSKSLQATIKNLVSGATAATSNTTKKQYTYTVAKGDTLKSISIKYGVTLDSIKKGNSLTSNEISVGQKLIITF
jgi:LysM repeat protein